MRLRRPLLLLLFSTGIAHSGYNSLQWESQWGAYTASVLEDFHVSAREKRGQLFVQLSEGVNPAPENTSVSARLTLGNQLIYEGEVPFLTDGSSERLRYRAYYLDIPLQEAGRYQLELAASGTLGAASATYSVTTQGAVSALDYLPSGILILIASGGLALLFLPIRKESHETVTSTRPRQP